MISAWRWFKDHAWLLCILIVLGVLWVIAKGPDKQKLLEQIGLERKVVKERAEVRKALLIGERADAVRAVEDKFAIAIMELRSDNHEKIRELEADPEALVEFIIRSSS